jgi:acetate kinase
MTAATGGLDLLVMTGGVGEHSWELREATADALAHLGVAVDRQRNRDATPDTDVSAADAQARTVVVTAREDLEIRRQVLDLLGVAESGGGNQPGPGDQELAPTQRRK